MEKVAQQKENNWKLLSILWLMLREMAYILKLSVLFGWFWNTSCILALSIFYLTSSCFFRGWRAVRGRSLEMLAPCSLKVLSFLPAELMCFCFKVMSLRRLKMWCKFFQVVLSRLRFLAPGMDDTVASTRHGWYCCMYRFLSGRCGCRIFLSTLARWSLACLPTLVPPQLPRDYMVTWISEQDPVPG